MSLVRPAHRWIKPYKMKYTPCHYYLSWKKKRGIFPSISFSSLVDSWSSSISLSSTGDFNHTCWAIAQGWDAWSDGGVSPSTRWPTKMLRNTVPSHGQSAPQSLRPRRLCLSPSVNPSRSCQCWPQRWQWKMLIAILVRANEVDEGVFGCLHVMEHRAQREVRRVYPSGYPSVWILPPTDDMALGDMLLFWEYCIFHVLSFSHSLSPSLFSLRQSIHFFLPLSLPIALYFYLCVLPLPFCMCMCVFVCMHSQSVSMHFCACPLEAWRSEMVFSLPVSFANSDSLSPDRGLCWQCHTARAWPFTPHRYQQWDSCKQHPLLSAYL